MVVMCGAIAQNCSSVGQTRLQGYGNGRSGAPRVQGAKCAAAGSIRGSVAMDGLARSANLSGSCAAAETRRCGVDFHLSPSHHQQSWMMELFSSIYCRDAMPLPDSPFRYRM